MTKKHICFMLVFSMILISFPNFVAIRAAADSPRIEAVRGEVFVQRIGGHSLTAVYRGMPIYDGDVIMTGIDSTATVIYYGQMIIMGELTTLSINAVWQRHGRNNSAITLVEGMIKVRVDVRLDDGSNNMVQAAGTIVGVRGTKYILTYRRMIFDDGEVGVGNPFVRMLVIDGEIIVDLPDPDHLGAVASFLVTPHGMQRLSEDIQGRQTFDEVEDIPEMFAIPLESLDLTILEAIRNDPQAMAQNPELFSRIEEAIVLRREEDELRRQNLQERPAPQIIVASQAAEILPNLQPPSAMPIAPELPDVPVSLIPSTPPEPPAPPATPISPESPAPPVPSALPEPPAPPATPALPEPPAPPATPATPELPAPPATPATPEPPAPLAPPELPAPPAPPAPPEPPAPPTPPTPPIPPAPPTSITPPESSDPDQNPDSNPIPNPPPLPPPPQPPVEYPTEEPPTEYPTEEPSTEPPTEEPSTEPPTEYPTEEPSTEPPTEYPTEEPTTEPPSEYPTTELPTIPDPPTSPLTMTINNPYTNPAIRTLIPIASSDNVYTNTLTFTVEVSGLTTAGLSEDMQLSIGAINGLSFNGHNIEGDFDNGTRTFTVTVTYDDLDATFVNTIQSISIDLLGLGLYVYNDGPQTTSVNILDGQAAARSIPITNDNIHAFNTYLTDDGKAVLRERHFVLVEDITNLGSWTPIPNFNGVFNGDRHTISGMILSGATNQGMFSQVLSDGVVTNVGLLDLQMGGVSAAAAGGIIAVNHGRIENSFVDGGNINGSGASIGGLVGNNMPSGIISNCFARINITASSSNIGGIVGANGGTLEHNVALNQQITYSGGRVGRIVGLTTGVTTNNYSLGTMIFNPPNPAGPIAGYHGITITSGNIDTVQNMLNTAHGLNAPILSGIAGMSFAYLPIQSSIDLPTDEPTDDSTNNPTDDPTDTPTDNPSDNPTNNPTDDPTDNPTDAPTNSPDKNPTDNPTDNPSEDADDETEDDADESKQDPPYTKKDDEPSGDDTQEDHSIE